MSGFPAAECIQSLIYFKIATITAAFFYHIVAMWVLPILFCYTKRFNN